jgi:hypothetical protein
MQLQLGSFSPQTMAVSNHRSAESRFTPAAKH